MSALERRLTALVQEIGLLGVRTPSDADRIGEESEEPDREPEPEREKRELLS